MAEKNSFYIPGEAESYESHIYEEIPEEHLVSKKLLPEWAHAEWNIPDRVSGEIGDGNEISPFRPWRRRVKREIYDRLKILPEQTQSQYMEREFPEGPQPPTIFFDGVPNFSEVPAFLPNTSFGQIETERGEWGQLISTFSQAATGILESERRRYEAQKQAYQATVAPTRVTTGIRETFSDKTLVYLLIGIGAFLLLKHTEKKKGTK